MKARIVGILAALGLIAGGMAIATADVPSPDPCDKVTATRAYVKCRMDRLEKKIDGDYTPPTPTPSVTPSQTPTPTVTPTPSVTPSPSVTPTPTPTPTQPAGDFPNADNTGPTGTLTTYTGPTTITVPTTITGKKITGLLVVKADLTIKNSELVGNIDNDYGKKLVVEDSFLNGGTSQAPVVGYSNITMKRTEVKGSRVSVLCGDNCDIQDSWLHGQYVKAGTDWHANGYISNGGSNVLVKHNTLACDAPNNSSDGGCTGPAASFGDFDQLDNIVYENNLLKAGPGSYCLYAGHEPGKAFPNPRGVKVTGNVFERGSNNKCASYGPATSFLPGSGVYPVGHPKAGQAWSNVWSGNIWSNGGVVAQP